MIYDIWYIYTGNVTHCKKNCWWCLIWCYFKANQTFLSWGPLAQQENIGGKGLASTSCFLRSQAMAEVPYIVRCMTATIKNIFSTGGILVAFNVLEMILMTPFIPFHCFATHYDSERTGSGGWARRWEGRLALWEPEWLSKPTRCSRRSRGGSSMLEASGCDLW